MLKNPFVENWCEAIAAPKMRAHFQDLAVYPATVKFLILFALLKMAY